MDPWQLQFFLLGSLCLWGQGDERCELSESGGGSPRVGLKVVVGLSEVIFRK